MGGGIPSAAQNLHWEWLGDYEASEILTWINCIYKASYLSSSYLKKLT